MVRGLWQGVLAGDGIQRPGANSLKMRAQTGSCRLFLSNPKPMVGGWEQATAPMMRAMGCVSLC